jgi:uncharacterized protein YaaW (UPF0174 family)
MSEIKLKEPDDDLIPLLRRCTAEELDNLVGYLTQRGGAASQLKSTDVYRQWFPEHTRYADEIAAEIQKFGGNTIFNLMRGGVGVSYREIVSNVAGRLKVEVDRAAPVADIEAQILLKVLEKSWEKMSREEKSTLLEGIMPETGAADLPREFPVPLVQAAIIAGGGFAAYQLSLIVAAAISRATLQRGISFAASAVLSRWAAVFAGAVGLGLAALWTVFDVLGPAYRVIIPCVLHIAMLRQLYALRDSTGEPAAAAASGGNTDRREILFRKF